MKNLKEYMNGKNGKSDGKTSVSTNVSSPNGDKNSITNNKDKENNPVEIDNGISECPKSKKRIWEFYRPILAVSIIISIVFILWSSLSLSVPKETFTKSNEVLTPKGDSAIMWNKIKTDSVVISSTKRTITFYSKSANNRWKKNYSLQVRPIQISNINVSAIESANTRSMIISSICLVLIILLIILFISIHKSIVEKDDDLINQKGLLGNARNENSDKDQKIATLNNDNNNLNVQNTKIEEQKKSIEKELNQWKKNFENITQLSDNEKPEEIVKEIDKLFDYKEKTEQFIKIINDRLGCNINIEENNIKFNEMLDCFLKSENNRQEEDQKNRPDHIIKVIDDAEGHLSTIWRSCRDLNDFKLKLYPEFKKIVETKTTTPQPKEYSEKSPELSDIQKKLDKAKKEVENLSQNKKSIEDEKEKLIQENKVLISDKANLSKKVEELKNEIGSDNLKALDKVKELLGKEKLESNTIKSEIQKHVALSLSENIKEFEDIQDFGQMKSKLTEIINDRINKTKEANNAKQTAEQAINNMNTAQLKVQEGYKNVFEDEIDAKNIIDAVEKYNTKSKEFKDQKQNEIEKISKEMGKKEESYKNDKDKLNASLEEKEAVVLSFQQQVDGYSKEIIDQAKDAAKELVDSIKDNNFLLRTLKDGGFAQNMEEIYEKLTNSAEKFYRQNISPLETKGKKPEECFNEIQKILESELNEGTLFTTIAQYYAYSRLQFMSDNTASYGLQFNRLGIRRIYEALENLLTCFELRLQLPNLYAEYQGDWEYQDVTGDNVRKGLDFLIPNSENHRAKIDNENTENIILDFTEIGYTKNGKIVKPTKVII